MDQLDIEKGLILCYVLCAAFGGMASITTGVAWSYWYRTLDQCVGRNCSCILYGKNTISVFLGGDQAPCIWVTFGPLLYVFFGLCMTCFHGYRVLFIKKSCRRRTRRTIVPIMEHGSSVAQEDTSILPRAYWIWITVSVLTSLVFIYSLVHFAIFVDGYYTTCKQYRRFIVNALGVLGSVPVLYGKSYCKVIFGLMDDMQLATGNAQRNGFINTDLSLSLGIGAAFFACVLFLAASFLNVTMARRKYKCLRFQQIRRYQTHHSYLLSFSA